MPFTPEEIETIREGLRWGRRAADDCITEAEGSSILSNMWRTRLAKIDDAIRLLAECQ
jgi:hypothetical protein